jgi:hypothetical protein
LAREIGGGGTGNEAAIAHHDNLIGDAFDLIKFVRDIDDGNPIFLKLAYQRE